MHAYHFSPHLAIVFMFIVAGIRGFPLVNVRSVMISATVRLVHAQTYSAGAEVGVDTCTKRKRASKVSTSVTAATSSIFETQPAKPVRVSNTKDNAEITALVTGKSLARSDQYVAFELYTEPVALQRHRTLKTGMVYNPSAKQQKQFLEFAKPYLNDAPLEGPLEARMIFHFGRPQNHYRTGRYSDVLREGVDHWHTSHKGKLLMSRLPIEKVSYSSHVQFCRY
jgi:hypothetical protein